MRFFFSAILLLLVALSGCQKSNPNGLFLQTYATQIAAPTYRQLVDQSEQLEQSTTQCTSPTDQQFLAQTQDQWRRTMGAWQAAKTIRFGPVVEQRIDWEFQFWPDKKNLVGKKARPLLKQSEAITEDQIKNSSVVLHGLSALELLLFDSTATANANPARYCELVRWIGKNIFTNAKLLDSGWALLQPEFVTPSEESDWFGDEATAVGNVLDSYLAVLEELSNNKIGDVIGDGQHQQANPYLLESWRSQYSWDNILVNLTSINRLFNEGGFSTYLQSLGFAKLESQLQAALSELNASASHVSAPLFTDLQQQSNALRKVQISAQQLQSLLKNDITQVLSLPVGFNDQDGD